MTTILLVATAFLGYLYYRFDRPATIAFVLGTVGIMAGAQVYSLGAAITDIERLFGILVILVGMLYAWEAFTSYRSGRTEDREEELIENLEELEDELQDAREQEDWPLVRKLQEQVRKARQYQEEFAVDTGSSNIRQKVKRKRQQRKWRKFDEEGTL